MIPVHAINTAVIYISTRLQDKAAHRLKFSSILETRKALAFILKSPWISKDYPKNVMRTWNIVSQNVEPFF